MQPLCVFTILGYHTSKSAGAGTELIYEADAQAHPLSRMSAMLDEVTRTRCPARAAALKHVDGASREQADPHSDDDLEPTFGRTRESNRSLKLLVALLLSQQRVFPEECTQRPDLLVHWHTEGTSRKIQHKSSEALLAPRMHHSRFHR